MLRGDVITGLQKISAIQTIPEGDVLTYIKYVCKCAAVMLEEDDVVSMSVYDEEEIHHNCTVQVLRNSVTGDTSVGCWKEDGDEQT